MLSNNPNGLDKQGENPPSSRFEYTNYASIPPPTNNPDWFMVVPRRRRRRVVPPVPVAMDVEVSSSAQTESKRGLFSFFSMGGHRSSESAASDRVCSDIVEAPRPVGHSPPKHSVAENSLPTASRHAYGRGAPVEYGALAKPLWERTCKAPVNPMAMNPIHPASYTSSSGGGSKTHVETNESSFLSPLPLGTSIRPPAPVGPRVWMRWASPELSAGSAAPSSSNISSSSISLASKSHGVSSSVGLGFSTDTDSKHLNAFREDFAFGLPFLPDSCNAEVPGPSTAANAASSSSAFLRSSPLHSNTMATRLDKSANPHLPSNQFTTTTTTTNQQISNPSLASNPESLPLGFFYSMKTTAPPEQLHEPHHNNSALRLAEGIHQSQAENTSSSSKVQFASPSPLTSIPRNRAVIESNSEQDIWSSNAVFHGSNLHFEASNENTNNYSNQPKGIVALPDNSALFAHPSVAGVYFHAPQPVESPFHASQQLTPFTAPSAVIPVHVDPVSYLTTTPSLPQSFVSPFKDTEQTVASPSVALENSVFGTGVTAPFQFSSGALVDEDEDPMDIARKFLDYVVKYTTSDEAASNQTGGTITPSEMHASIPARGSSSPTVSFTSRVFTNASRNSSQWKHPLFPSV